MVTQTVYLTPPDFLLECRTVDKWQGGTLKDLTDYAAKLRDALDACNRDKGLVREWVEKRGKDGQKGE